MNVTLEMYQNAKTMMVCAPAWQCAKEESCFNLAKTVIDAWESQEHSAACTRSDAVANYAPHFPPVVGWEWRVDWDAA